MKIPKFMMKKIQTFVSFPLFGVRYSFWLKVL